MRIARNDQPPRSGFLDDPPNRLRELRIYADVTQDDVIRWLRRNGHRVPRTHLSQWERGERPIPEEMYAPLAEGFGVPVEELFVPPVESGPFTFPAEWV